MYVGWPFLLKMRSSGNGKQPKCLSTLTMWEERAAAPADWLPDGAQCHWKCPEPPERNDTLQEAKQENFTLPTFQSINVLSVLPCL